MANKSLARYRFGWAYGYAQRRHYEDQNREIINNYLAFNPCVDCGENDPLILEFDHRDPRRKRFEIIRAKRKTYGAETLVREIEKCDIRCCNCHRRKHYLEFYQ